MFAKKPEKSADEYWKEYEEQINEKVLCKGLGRYMSGWGEFDSNGWNNIWGLIIAGSKSFRFHHFPEKNWVQSLLQRDNTKGPKEKLFFIPYEKINSVKLIVETRWWVKIFSTASPKLIILYRDETGAEKELLLEADFGSKELTEKLNELAG